MTIETNLVLGSYIIPIGSGRGITQTLNIVNNGVMRRTVNGSLVDLTRDQNRKFDSKISANDLITPTMAGIWKGMELEVQCIATIRQLQFNSGGYLLLEDGGIHLLEDGGGDELDVIGADVLTLIRDPVAGSIVGRGLSGQKIATTIISGRDVTFADTIAYAEFRPKLQMRVSDITLSDDEYSAKQNWQIDLEEI